MTNKNNNSMKSKYVIFAGGETAGPVMPLLALAEAWKLSDPNIAPVFIDVKKSVASRVVPQRLFKFKAMTAGKLRRYWSIKNFISPILIVVGFFQSLIYLAVTRPIVVIGAGGYVQVPVIVAAWFLRIPVVIHQQDIIPSYSNKICAPFAKKITTTFERSTKDFSQGLGFAKNYSQYTKTVWTGNPNNIVVATNISAEKEERNAALKLFNLDPQWPTVLVVGGGSGARGLNQALAHNLPELLKVAQVIHSAGPGKQIQMPEELPIQNHDRYHQYEFINQINKAYVAADVVISRAGISTITALSVLKKLSIIVPMPDSHQEANAQYLFEQGAIVALDQSEITADTFAKITKKVLFDVKLQEQLKTAMGTIMPADSTTKMLEVVTTLIHE